MKPSLDCVIIGYNETPFDEYERLIYTYGQDSEAYRDLKFSFVDLENDKITYVGLLNRIYNNAKRHIGIKSDHEEFKSGDIPNLAAAYLTYFLRKRGLLADYINLYQYEKDKLIDLLASNPICVAITTTFYVLNMPVIEIVQFIRQHNKNVKIIVGGPLISNHYRRYHDGELEAALDDIGADIYVIDSQGELTLLQIVNALKSGGTLDEVPNLIYTNSSGYCTTRRMPEVNSLDESFIDWISFSDKNIGRTIQTRTARSCAFSCAFCAYPLRAGKLALATLETIERELDSMDQLGTIKNVVFIDDTFNVPLERFKNICRLMIKKNYAFNWFSYFRCSNSDEEAIELMAESGCKGVFLGIKSGSPAILENMHKAAVVEKYVKGIELLRRHHILTFGSFITGFPGETERTVKETVDFIKDTKLDYYRTQLWYCEPGTPIDQRRDEFQISGQGFVWQHKTMDSLEAMDYIEKMFLTIDGPLWLPQWSFDFWIIPYLLGKGISLDQFKEWMSLAHKLLALEIAYVPTDQKKTMQQAYLQAMVETVKHWSLVSQSTSKPMSAPASGMGC